MKQRWNPEARPQPITAWLDFKDHLYGTMHNGKMPMTDHDHKNMISYHHLALLNTRQGNASEQSLRYLAMACNMSMILSENGIGGEECLELVDQVQPALLRAIARGQASGSWRFDGPGLQVMDELLSVFDDQLRIATRNEIQAAKEDMEARVARNDVLGGPVTCV